MTNFFGCNTENALQGLLEYYYCGLGYKVNWIHKEDKRREPDYGCDLLCEKNTETIAFVVKQRPRKRDFKQIKNLSSKNYSNKRCIYLEMPTLEFLEQTKPYGDVTFEDIKEWENEIKNTDLGLELLSFWHFASSTFVDLANDVLNHLLKQRKEGNVEINSQKRDLNELLRLTRAVAKMRGVSSLLKAFTEKQFNPLPSASLSLILDEVIKELNHNMLEFYLAWQQLLGREHHLLRKLFLTFNTRSNWGDFRNFKSELDHKFNAKEPRQSIMNCPLPYNQFLELVACDVSEFIAALSGLVDQLFSCCGFSLLQEEQL